MNSTSQLYNSDEMMMSNIYDRYQYMHKQQVITTYAHQAYDDVEIVWTRTGTVFFRLDNNQSQHPSESYQMQAHNYMTLDHLTNYFSNILQFETRNAYHSNQFGPSYTVDRYAIIIKRDARKLWNELIKLGLR